MSFTFEVYLGPNQPQVESEVARIAEKYGGHLESRDEQPIHNRGLVIELTFEFHDEVSACSAEKAVKEAGFHTEGVGQYGDD